MAHLYETPELANDEINARVEAKRVQHMQHVWSEVLKLPDGKLLAWDILQRSGMFRPSYSGNAHTNFLEGERNIALWLWADRLEPTGASHLSQMMIAHEEFVEGLTHEVTASMDAEQED